MKAFSVNYPLKDEDKNKIDHLKSSYENRMAISVKKDNEDIRLMHPKLNLDEPVITFWA